MSISVDNDDLTEFEKNFRTRYNASLYQFLQEFNLNQYCSINGWVPGALRQIADFIESQRKQKCSNCGSTNHEPITLITEGKTNRFKVNVCRECNAVFA